jgi:hypothetical protein
MTRVKSRHLQQVDYPQQILKPYPFSLMPGQWKAPRSSTDRYGGA